MTEQCTKKVVIITGSAGGIGQALCKAYKDKGYFVVATGRKMPEIFAHADHLMNLDLNDLVTVPGKAKSFRDELKQAINGRQIYCLINNAAIQILGGLQELSIDNMTLSFNVNAIAPFILSQLFERDLTEAQGSILNIGTVHAQSTKKGFTAYATSKTAMHGLTRALALDLGGRVRVNTLAPAAIETPMLKAGFEGNAAGYAELNACHPVGRIGSVEEIANTALFLSSPEASFITGATLHVDGGILSKLHDPA